MAFSLVLRLINKKPGSWRLGYPLLASFILLDCGSLYAAPQITGRILSGDTIEITGTAFGDQGPNIIIFDDFEHGTPAQPIALNATHGTWTGTSNNPTYFDDDGTIAALLTDAETSRQLKLSFSSVQELFLSYKVKIPQGHHFPNTALHGTFAPDSAWKLAWIFDGPEGYKGDDDLTLPTWPNGTYFMIGGNDNAFQTETGRPGTTNWFGFDEWNRFSVYLKGGANPAVDQGVLYAQGISASNGLQEFNAAPIIFDGDDNDFDNPVSQWNELRVPGWHRTNGVNAAYDNMVRGIYDEIYLATGENAFARVEVGDHNDYTKCKTLELLMPETWGDTSITARLPSADSPQGAQRYVFVVDTNGEVSEGFPVFEVPTINSILLIQ